MGAATLTDEPLAVMEPQIEQPKGRGRFWLVLCVLLGLSLLALYRSALLRVGAVEIAGLQRLPRERIIELAGLYPGAPRWENLPAAVEVRLRQEPWIKTAAVRWEWNRVLIEIQERAPVGLLRYQNVYVSLDETATILEQVKSPAEEKLPVVGGVHTNTALRGQQLSHEGLKDGLLVLAWMAPPLREQVSEIAVAERELTLFMASGATVRWGQVPLGKEREEHVRQKVEDFGELWAKVDRKKAPTCTIDLRVSGNRFMSGCE